MRYADHHIKLQSPTARLLEANNDAWSWTVCELPVFDHVHICTLILPHTYCLLSPFFFYLKKKKSLIWVALPALSTTAAREAPPIADNVCSIFVSVQIVIWLAVFSIFNTHTDVDACNYTWGLCKCRKRICTESWLVQKSLAAPPGNRTCVSLVPGFWVWHCTSSLPTQASSFFFFPFFFSFHFSF